MGICEKCWEDAGRRVFFDPSKSQTDHYHDLLEERKDRHCMNEEHELPEATDAN